MAYALADATPDETAISSKIIVTTTIFIVAFTTLLLGGLAFPFLKWLRPPIMRSTQQTKTDTYDISNHWFNRLDRRFLRPFFGPKSRKHDNLNRPLTSLDEIEMNEQKKKEGLAEKTASNKFNMEYINTHKTEEEAEREEEEKTDDNGIKIQIQSAIDHEPATLTKGDSKSLIDYSMPQTQQPSFVDDPKGNQREPSEQSNTQTWSDVHSLQAPHSEKVNKAVTPPPAIENIMNELGTE